jgi:hypothetical protein
MSTEAVHIPAGEAGRFVGLASARWDGLIAAWKAKGDALLAGLAIPSLVLDTEIAAERARIQQRFEEAWKAECRLMLADVSVDLLQFGKAPLSEEESQAIEERRMPDFAYPFTPPESNVDTALNPIVGGAAAGALAGAGFAGIGAVPGAVIGAIGGLMYGGHSHATEVADRIRHGLAIALEQAHTRMRTGKLKFVEQLLELRWRSGT